MATFKDVRRGQLYGGDSDGADPFGVREYQAGDAVIGQPDAFDVSTRESRKEVPRPAGISDAPRPAASSFIRPTEGQTDVLERMKSVQAAGTVSARKAERERIEQAPIIEARREQAVKDAATEKKVAFEQELALKGESAKVSGEQSIALETLKTTNDSLAQGVKDDFEREKLQDARREAIRGREATARVQALKSKTDVFLKQMDLLAKKTPIQEARIGQIKAIEEQRDSLETDIATLTGLIPTAKAMGTSDKIEEQIKDKKAKLDGLDVRQDELIENLEKEGFSALDERDTIAGEAGEAIGEFEEASTEAPAGDINGDGKVDVDEKEYNELSIQVRRKNELLAGGLDQNKFDIMVKRQKELKEKLGLN